MLTQIEDGLWTVDAPLAVAGFQIGCRSTLVRLQDGKLWMHSPIAFSEADAEAIRKVGPVAYVVAPNLFHHLYLRRARELFPDASFYGPAGLAEKRKNFRFDGRLDTSPLPWDADIHSFPLAGLPKYREVVFFHPGSETLIVTDLFFNLTRFPNFRSRLLGRLFGTRNGFAVSRLFMTMVRDKNALAESLRAVLRLPIRRVVLAHGDIAEGSSREPILRALEARGIRVEEKHA